MERTIQKRVPVAGDSWVTVDVYGDQDRPGLVVVPGAMSDAHTWRRVATAVTAWPSVAVVNRRGRAPSGPLTSTYSLHTEIADLGAVLAVLPGTRTLFGWSYGGLIALLAADDRADDQADNRADDRRPGHVIAYEPVMRPFAAHALPELGAADAKADWDAVVTLVNQRISGFDAAHVDALRADPETWATLRRLGRPAYAELAALNAEPAPDTLARQADRVDLVVGEHNHGTAPYGTSFDDVHRRLPHAAVHVLPGQGHLAHLQAPTALARLLDALAATR